MSSSDRDGNKSTFDDSISIGFAIAGRCKATTTTTHQWTIGGPYADQLGRLAVAQRRPDDGPPVARRGGPLVARTAGKTNEMVWEMGVARLAMVGRRSMDGLDTSRRSTSPT